MTGRAKISALPVLLARFKPDGDCLMYRKTVHPYGIVSTVHGRMTTHRAAFILAGKPIPEGRFDVCHTCDRPGCCNVDHLFAAPHAANMSDKALKGRHNNAARTFLTSGQKLHAVALRAEGRTCKAIAPLFGVTANCIGQLTRRHAL